MSSMDAKSQEYNDVWKERARTLVNEDPGLTDQRIQELKELVKSEPRLKAPDEREFYLKFLRAGLSDPKSGFDIIKNFFTLRTKGNYFEVIFSGVYIFSLNSDHRAPQIWRNWPGRHSASRFTPCSLTGKNKGDILEYTQLFC